MRNNKDMIRAVPGAPDDVQDRVRIEMRSVNLDYGVWARVVHRVHKTEDGETVREQGYAISHGGSRTTCTRWVDTHGPLGAWRLCYRWLQRTTGQGPGLPGVH